MTDLLGELGFDRHTGVQIRLRLLDTFDGRLAAAGLRLVHEGAAGRMGTLTLGGSGVVPAQIELAEPPRTAVDLPPGPIRRRLDAVLVERALVVVLDVTARGARFERRDRRDKIVTSAWLFDRLRARPGPYGVVDDGAPSKPPAWVLEAGRVTGHEQQRDRLESELDGLGLDRRRGSVLDVMADVSGVDLAGFDGSPTIPLRRTAPIIESTRAVLTHLTRSVDANWQGTLDDVDPEFLHDLRVALRRIRSVLGETERVLPAAFGAEARQRFRDLARATSDARDLDVYGLEWPTYTAALDEATVADLAPVLPLLAEHRAAAYDRLRRMLDDPATAEWRATWARWLAEPVTDHDQGSAQHRPTGPFVAHRLERAVERLLADGRAIDDDTPAEKLHDLRKDAKRVRYLVECLGGVVDEELRRPFVTPLKKLQTVLGEHQDAEVHIAHLRELSDDLHRRRTSPATLVAVGRLAEQLDGRRARARAEFAHRWQRFDAKRTRRALRDLCDGADV